MGYGYDMMYDMVIFFILSNRIYTYFGGSCCRRNVYEHENRLYNFTTPFMSGNHYFLLRGVNYVLWKCYFMYVNGIYSYFLLHAYGWAMS